MQNTDYGKRFRKEKSKPIIQPRPQPSEQVFKKTPPVKKQNQSFAELFSGLFSGFNQSQPAGYFYFFLIGMLLFTTGVYVGMKLDQKESTFASNELNSYRNIQTDNQPELSEKKSSPKVDLNEDAHSTKEEILDSGNTASVPKNLQFPPKLNQVNYIIQLGNFSREDATKWAASLIREKQEFQGRIFRTSTGKLYLGYYYDLKEAKVVLKKVKKFQNGPFQDASIKNIQF